MCPATNIHANELPQSLVDSYGHAITIGTAMRPRKHQPASLLTLVDPSASAPRSDQGAAAPGREGHADAMVGMAVPDFYTNHLLYYLTLTSITCMNPL